MILSRKFIKDYIDLDDNLTIKQIAEDMTNVGNEYDSAKKLIDCTNLITGEVIECNKILESDHLNACKVDIGTSVLNIVCGAPNVRKGIKVIVAKDNAILPQKTIKKSVIKGYESNGMLCSLQELGIDNKFLKEEDKLGICELDPNTKIGEDPIKILGLDDEIIDFELTANRADELSVLGLAYELGAIYNKKVKDIDLSFNEKTEKINFNLEVKTDKCSLFLIKKVKNLIIKESPDFIKNRLISCGIRPINNVVDISNYVMLETGQPLHFYDADRLGDTIVVRDAKDLEKLTTLDGNTRILTKDDLVIANKEKPVGLAGVMGGLTTEVENDTKNIIIESAIFDPISVRKTSKKVIRSEASNRFEKSLDPNRTYMAMKRCCNLLEKYATGDILKDTIIYDKTSKEDKIINITCKDINDVLGSNISETDIIDVFNRLDFEVETGDILKVKVPTRRLDINIKEDLIEEVGRIYGINNIKGKLPILKIKKGSYDKLTRDIRNKMVNLGLNEVMTQIFVSEDLVHTFTNDDFETVKLLDPLSVDKNSLRYSIVTTLLKVYNYNKSHNNNNISIFEMAKGFYLKNDKYYEDYKLGLLMTGDYYLNLGNNQKVDFYVLKGIIEELLDYLGYENRYTFKIDENIPNDLHPKVSSSIIVNGVCVGYFGKVHPKVLKDDVYVAEINIDKLKSFKTGKIKYKEFSKYPDVKKDLAFIVDKSISCEKLTKCIKNSGGSLLKEIELFDLYTGDNVNKDEKSLAFTLTFKDDSKTLTEEEVMKVFNYIIDFTKKNLNAKIRS